MIWDGVVEVIPWTTFNAQGREEFHPGRARLTSPLSVVPCSVSIQPPLPGHQESFGLWHQRLLVVGQRFQWHVGTRTDKVTFRDT